MNERIDAPAAAAALEQVLRALRRRLAEVEAWSDSAVKDVAQEAVREEMTRIGRERAELEWRWA